MWLAWVPPGGHAAAAADAPHHQALAAPQCNALVQQAKVAPRCTSRSSTSSGWCARRVQRGCASSTVVGRSQQGAEACAGPPVQQPSYDELPSSSSSSAHSRQQQVPPLLQVQQAGQGLATSALDLQPSQYHLQQQQPAQTTNRQTGVLHWLAGSAPASTNGHSQAQQQPLLFGDAAVQQGLEHLTEQQLQHGPPLHTPARAFKAACGDTDPSSVGGQQGQQGQPQQPQQPQPVQQLWPQQVTRQAVQPLPPPPLPPPPPSQPPPQHLQSVLQQRPQDPKQQQQQQQPLPGQQRPPGQRSRDPPLITSSIQRRRTVPQLQDLYQRCSSDFNAINLAALLSRLAHIYPSYAASQQDQAAAAATVQQFAVRVMQQLVPRLGECDTGRQAANAVWAVAALRCELPQGLLAAAAAQLTAHRGQLLAGSLPQELANLAWGLAKLQHDPTCSVWQQLAGTAAPQLAAFKPGELAMLCWALADTQQRLQQQQEQHWQQQQQQHVQHMQRQQQQRQQYRLQQQQPGLATFSTSSCSSSCEESWEPPGSHWLSAQQAARRQSNAEASSSSSSSSRAPVSLRRNGSSSTTTNSSSSRGSPQPRLSLPPVRPMGRAGSDQDSAAAGHAGSSSGSSSHSHQSSSSSSWMSSDAATASPGLAACLQQQLLPSLADVVVQQLQQGSVQYRAREVSTLLWCCGVLGFRQEGLLGALSLTLQQQLQEGRCASQDVANSVWALAKLQVLQPQLLAAAADQHTQWLEQCSCQELGLVLYGSAAGMQQQRHLLQAGSSDMSMSAAATLWQLAAPLVLSGAALQDLGAAEAATLVQAAAFVLEPARHRSSRRQRPRLLQPHPRQQQQDESSSSSGSTEPAGINNSSSTSSLSGSATNSLWSMTSMTSLDSWDEAATAAAAAVVPAQARQLLAAVDAALCTQAESGGQQLLSGQHVAALLHSWAAVGVVPSPGLQELLLGAAAAAAPSMDCQELAMTAWSVAKLFGGRRRSEAVQQLMEAVDRAAVPLLGSMSPLQLSMLAWAHGRLWELGDSLFMHQLAQAALQQVHQFGPQALSNLLWAFATLRHYDAALTAAVGRRSRALLGQFTPAELANLTWALVTLRHRQSGLLRAIAHHAAAACSSWDAKACVKLAVTLCGRGMPAHRYRSVLSALADSLAAKPVRAWLRLTPHELVQLAVAFAVGRVRHRTCMAQVSAVALAWLPRIALCDVVSLVWALAMLGHPHDALLEAVSSRVASELQADDDNRQQQQEQEQQQQAAADSGSQRPASSVREALQQLLERAKAHNPLAAAAAAAAAAVASGAVGAGGDACAPSAPGQGQQQQQDGGSSVLSGLPIDVVVNSRLKSHHLARLAWSYKTFGHPDADWYLAAGQLVATAWDGAGGVGSSSSGGGFVRSSFISNSWGSSSSGGSMQGVQRPLSPLPRAAVGDAQHATSNGGSSSSSSPVAAMGSSNGSSHGCVAVVGDTVQQGLRRPAHRPHRPVPVPAAVAPTTHRQSQ